LQYIRKRKIEHHLNIAYSVYTIVFEASPRRQGVAEALGVEGATTYTRMASA